MAVECEHCGLPEPICICIDADEVDGLPEGDFDEWAEEEFDEGERFFLIPEYRPRF